MDWISCIEGLYYLEGVSAIDEVDLALDLWDSVDCWGFDLGNITYGDVFGVDKELFQLGWVEPIESLSLGSYKEILIIIS